MSVKSLAIDLIRCDGGTQMRAELSTDVYMDYRDKILAGVEFPPLDVFYDGSEYWLADGFHRFYGHREAKKASVKCTVHNGTKRDAILFAVGANTKHGLPRSHEDKRNSVRTLLNDETWVKWSDSKIAEQAAVTQPFVSGIRKELITIISSPAAKTADEPKIGKDGKARKPKPEKKKTPAVDFGDRSRGQAEPPAAVDNDFTRNVAKAEAKAATFPDKVRAHNLEIERFARSIMEAFANPPASVWLDESRLGIAQDQIKSACATIRQAKAHDKPCPRCDGEGSHTGRPCKWCKGAGFMPQTSYEMAGGQ